MEKTKLKDISLKIAGVFMPILFIVLLICTYLLMLFSTNSNIGLVINLIKIFMGVEIIILIFYIWLEYSIRFDK